jgi:hypothetical protein
MIESNIARRMPALYARITLAAAVFGLFRLVQLLLVAGPVALHGKLYRIAVTQLPAGAAAFSRSATLSSRFGKIESREIPPAVRRREIGAIMYPGNEAR